MSEPLEDIFPGSQEVTFTERELRFVEILSADPKGNATAAARKAGYPERSAKQRAYELMNSERFSHVQDALNARKLERLAKCKVNRQKALQELAYIAFGNPGDIFDWGPDGITLRPLESLWPEQCVMIGSISHTTTPVGTSVTVRLANKVKALELLLRYIPAEDPDGYKAARAEVEEFLAFAREQLLAAKAACARARDAGAYTMKGNENVENIES